MCFNNIINPRNYNINFTHKEIILDNFLFNNFFDIITRLDLGKKYIIISDENLFTKIISSFPLIKNFNNFIILPKNINADYELAIKLSQQIKQYDFAIAIGSGTINDLVKYASYLIGKPYIIFATAPSMNGYLSANSSLSKNQLKQSFTAKPPIAAYFDIDILSNAPLRLIQSGFGDSLASKTVRADWLLSKYILDTPFTNLPFDILADLEAKIFAYPVQLLQRKPQYIAILTKVLILSGLSMIKTGSSMPASQGEHLLAHLYEILDPYNSHKTFHGEQIAFCSLYMNILQENILQNNSPPLLTIKPLNIKELQHLPQIIREESYVKFTKKHLSQINDIEKKLRLIWPNLIAEINNNPHYKPNGESLKKIIIEAKLAKNINSLNWQKKYFDIARKNALFIRDRFTFLDLEYYMNS